jgi:uncharacterized protein
VADLGFDRDPGKAAANRRKHGVGFDEAGSVFADEHALLLADPEHSAGEERFLLLGLSDRLRVLVVSHVYRQGEGLVRLISARKATRREARLYVRRRIG